MEASLERRAKDRVGRWEPSPARPVSELLSLTVNHRSRYRRMPNRECKPRFLEKQQNGVELPESFVGFVEEHGYSDGAVISSRWADMVFATCRIAAFNKIASSRMVRVPMVRIGPSPFRSPSRLRLCRRRPIVFV